MNSPEQRKQPLAYALRLFIHNGEGTRGSFGIGVDSLLRAIQQYGSLSKAAASMGMAYSKAWTILKHMEEYLGFPMVESHVGRGRGSQLTSAGEDFIRRYDSFTSEVNEFAAASFRRHFGDIS